MKAKIVTGKGASFHEGELKPSYWAREPYKEDQKKKMIEVNSDQIKNALVTLAIEQTLLEFGIPVLEKVNKKLFEDYHYYISDCYTKPEHLNEVLKDLFGNSHTVLVQSIRKRLEEFSSRDPIKNFLDKLSE